MTIEAQVIQRPVLHMPSPQPLRDQIRWTEDEEAAVHTLDSLPARRKHIPTVTCIFGRRGQGKTLLATTMGEQLKTRFDRAGLPFRLYSNYWMAAADRSDQHIVEELQEFPTWLNDSPYSLLEVDEVAELLPSLRPMANDNLLTMGFLKQIRKRGISAILATQYPQEVTMGILRQCDWFILTQSVEGGRHLKTYWWDWPGNITGRWGRKYFPPERDTHDFAVGYSQTWRMFGRYRTEEIIAPRFADRREEIRAEQERMRVDDGGEPEAALSAPAAGGQLAQPTHNLPPAVAVIIEDAAGSGVGVVLVEEIAEKLRRYWRRPKAQLSQIVTRLRAYGVDVLEDRAEPYLLYDPPAQAPAGA